MKKKTLSAAAAALLILSGCDTNSNSNNSSHRPQQQPQPQPQPTQEPEPERPVIPDAGIGSISGDLECTGGIIEIDYTFGEVESDSKSFVVEYQRNGVTEDLTYPATTTNGSRITVQDIYYVRENDTDRPVYWIVTISYHTSGEIYNLVTTQIKQPACGDEIQAVSTTYTVN
jgi:hypothetical protein